MEHTKLKTTQVRHTRIAFLETQNFMCELCGLPLTYEEAVLDHDHKTGAVRAAIHRSCNSGLGAIERVGRYGIKDILNFATGAACYLERHKESQTRVIHPAFFTNEEKIIRSKKKKIKQRKKLINERK